MLGYFRDKLHTAHLKARYERLIHERLVQMTESTGPTSVEEDPGHWQLVGRAKHAALDESARGDVRQRARQLVTHNPHARNILRLLEAYVAGPGLKLTHQARAMDVGERSPTDELLVREADRLWELFLVENQTHFSYREHARRSWRDGECFVRKFVTHAWPPAVRFVDPERIGGTPDDAESKGIVTEPHDVESPVAYLLLDLDTGRLRERIPADDLLHTRVGVDTNQKRGVTIFTPVLDMLDSFDQWMKTELLARKLQSSIVLWRKVQGSPQQASSLADAAGGGEYGLGGERRERLRPGTILTTNHSTEIEFLQPQTNFGDAVPLGRMLLLATAAGAGLPEFMLTADASNANYASTMVAEGPAVKLFQSEQAFFSGEFTRLWRWIMTEAVRSGLLPDDFFDRVQPDWTFPQLVNRDRPRERLADVRLVETRILSRAEVARRDGADPERMQTEIQSEGGGNPNELPRSGQQDDLHDLPAEPG